jgi:hypothetical protein
MSKKELIWRHILVEALERKKFEFTQSEIAEKLKVSLSTVFNALKIPRVQGAVKVTGRNFSLVDEEKLLYIWATQRNIGKELVYKTYVKSNPLEIEGMMPANAIFGAYSAYSKKYKDAPADYDKVYAYADSETVEEIKKRFSKSKGNYNIFILKSDPELSKFGGTTPDVQTFADLWNLSDWQAKEFLNKLKEKLF